MITEIYIEGQRLDLTADISSLLTLAIDDVKDFASRSTTFSKTVVLPGTANNNAIFGNIFDTGISNDYDPVLNNVGYNFNAAKSAKCIIFQDFLQTFSGTLRLLEIDKDKGRIEYQAALNGNLTTLNVALSSGYLTDLDFSAYNQLWNVANIVSSWNNSSGAGVFFPLMDNGNSSTLKHDWDYKTFKPALFVKEYIDKMFAKAGFRYNSDLFNTARFKQLIIPHNQKQLVKLNGIILTANNSVTTKVIDHIAGLFENDVPFDTHIGALFTYADTPSGGAGAAIRKFTYVGADTITTSLNIHHGGYYNFALGAGLNLTFSIIRNGVTYYTDPSKETANVGRDIHFTRDYILPLTMVTGDSFEVHWSLGGSLPGGAFGEAYAEGQTISVKSATNIIAPVDYNEEIDLSYAIPQNIRQVDFLSSIVKLFNLYVYEDQFDDRLINIKPFIEFYSTNFNDTVDWTYKMDRDQVVKIKPMSELNSKLYNFNYEKDGDYFNDLYNKRYNQTYGSYIYDSQFEFADQTNDLKLIFAGTPMVGYVGEDKVYSTIFKRTGDVVGQGEETLDSTIRILQAKKAEGVLSWKIYAGPKESGAVLGTYNYYGYAGHFDDPDFPTSDLNFGALKELFFILVSGDLTKTQFNVYWSTYMAEITDKDSKMLIAQFYLTAKDIFDLDFSKYVMVDGTLFRLNKITDYNCSNPGTCEVQLLRVINTAYTYVTFPPIVGDFAFDWDTGDPLLDSDSTELLYQ